MQQAVQNLIESRTNISPYDLVKDLLPQFYPVSDLVLDASKYFTTIIKRKDFCVEQDKLVKYGILSPFKNGQPKSTNVLRLLQQYNRIENIDYQQLNVEPVARKQGGGSKSIEYLMTPKTFFLCLTRSKNSCEYAEYYFHVLELYDYYEDYYTKIYKEEMQILNDYTIEQEETISSLEKMHRELMKKMDRQFEEMQKQNVKLDKQSEEMSKMQSTLDKIVKKLDDRAVPPSDNELTERFVLMKNTNTYCVIRTQERKLKKAIKEKEALGYTKVQDIIESELIPNSVYLWNTIKDTLSSERRMICRYNEFGLVDMSESDLVSIIKEVFKSRKELN